MKLAIAPILINTDNYFSNGFGSDAADLAAWWIVRYSQAKKAWVSFTFNDIVLFCNKENYSFNFSGLNQAKWLEEKNGVFTPTPLFILTCYTISPRKVSPRVRAIIELEQAVANLLTAMLYFEKVVGNLPLEQRPSPTDKVRADRACTSLLAALNSRISCLRSSRKAA